LYDHVTIAIAVFVVVAFAWFINGISYDNHHSLIDDNWYSVLAFVTLYVYSLFVSGSTGFLLILHKFIITLSHRVHCTHAVAQLYVI
jgi:hypothetical protein